MVQLRWLLDHIQGPLLYLQQVEEPGLRVVGDALEEFLVEQIQDNAVASELQKARKKATSKMRKVKLRLTGLSWPDLGYSSIFWRNL